MILCCGESLIDMIPAPLADGGTGMKPLPGGSVFNTALSLGRLCAPIGLLTGLSRDPFGMRLEDALDDAGVDMTLAVRSDRPTTLAIVTLTDGNASYHFMDENSAGRMLRIEDFPALPDRVRALFFGGISLACEPCADAYAAYAARYANDRLLMVDPNIRPDFIADRDRFMDRIRGMLALADVVKFSDDDLAWFLPDLRDMAERVAAVQALGARIVIVTQGARGATATLPDGTTVEVAARAANVIDTVGAGDTFNAGFLAQLEADGLCTKPALAAAGADQVRAALEFAARVAAVTVSRAGADPPRRSEV